MLPPSLIAGSLTYPVRGQNLAILGVGAGFLCVPPIMASLLPGLPYVGLIAVLIDAFVGAYMLIFFHSVMEASTKGDDDVPGYPDVSSAQDMLIDVIHVITPLLFCFLPMIGFWLWVVISGAWKGAESVTLTRVGITAALGLGGIGYLPIAMLIFSFYGELAILNVVGAARSIARMPGDYSKVVALLLALFFANGAVGWFLQYLPTLLAVPLGMFSGCYLLIVAMRAIGLLYHRNRVALDWERDQRAPKAW